MNSVLDSGPTTYVYNSKIEPNSDVTDSKRFTTMNEPQTTLSSGERFIYVMEIVGLIAIGILLCVIPFFFDSYKELIERRIEILSDSKADADVIPNQTFIDSHTSIRKNSTAEIAEERLKLQKERHEEEWRLQKEKHEKEMQELALRNAERDRIREAEIKAHNEKHAKEMQKLQERAKNFQIELQANHEKQKSEALALMHELEIKNKEQDARFQAILSQRAARLQLEKETEEQKQKNEKLVEKHRLELEGNLEKKRLEANKEIETIMNERLAKIEEEKRTQEEIIEKIQNKLNDMPEGPSQEREEAERELNEAIEVIEELDKSLQDENSKFAAIEHFRSQCEQIPFINPFINRIGGV